MHGLFHTTFLFLLFSLEHHNGISVFNVLPTPHNCNIAQPNDTNIKQKSMKSLCPLFTHLTRSERNPSE